jgi:protein TonB
MNTRIAILLAVGVLGGCAAPSSNGPREPSIGLIGPTGPTTEVEKVETRPDGTSVAGTFEGYKRDLAQRITQVNSTKVYTGRPQALLRSVVVVKYVVDSHGQLVRSELLRSNRDSATEATALTSLRNTAPFPKPLPHLLSHGRLEIAETWLFNSDGRFQLRTIAEPQMDQ